MKRLHLALAFIILSGLALNAPAATRTVTLAVPGMTCPVCPITVRKALMRIDGVSHVKVNYDKKEAIVTFDDAKAGINELRKATANAGYPSTVMSRR